MSITTALDADVLIYAAARGHPLGEQVRQLLTEPPGPLIGSTLLLPELLIKPSRNGTAAELEELLACLSYLQLLAADAEICMLAVTLGADYRLKSMDAVHLATAVHAGAEVFLTNNRKDFDRNIIELEVRYPDDL